jgi:pantoate--beta-alanine ligase
MTLPIVRTKSALRARIAEARAQGARVGLVPTMGALHDGHLSLVTAAKERASFVVATIFVNPTQFGPKEDFAKYPRDLSGDAAKLASVHTDLLFAPEPNEVYPAGFQTHVEVEHASLGLCGDLRPGHFRGVATVVSKLLLMARPDVAIFGEKDYQQLCVIKALSQDLDIDTEIVGYPTVREADGLAMSSRNAYLSAPERERALSLSRGLFAAASLARAGERDAARLVEAARALVAPQVDELQYLELREENTLHPVSRLEGPARLLVAVKIGSTRLIDNLAIQPFF